MGPRVSTMRASSSYQGRTEDPRLAGGKKKSTSEAIAGNGWSSKDPRIHGLPLLGGFEGDALAMLAASQGLRGKGPRP